MSLSVVLRSDDNFRRDSFEDRVCDDLCEVLLQFLPFEDKFKFECVSKQFQRNVFQRQYDLDMFSLKIRDVLGNNIASTLEKLMKKLPNIKSLRLLCLKNMNKNQMNTVFKNIPELEQMAAINCNPDTNTVINCLRQVSDKWLKIKALNVCNRMNSLALFMTEVNKLKALETLQFRLGLKHFEGLQTFEEYFNGLQSLTHLEISLLCHSTEDHIEKDLLKDIDIYLPKLRVLCLRIDYPIEVSEQTVDSLGRLSRLESILLKVNNESIRDLIIDKIIKNCKKIKSIDIKV